MPLRTREDLETFFEIDGGPATRTLIVGPVPSTPTPANHQFAKTLAAIFTLASRSVPVYGDTDIEAPEPSILCMTEDLDGVKPRMFVRFLGLLPGEDGYGKSYKITPRIVSQGYEKTRVYLEVVNES